MAHKLSMFLCAGFVLASSYAGAQERTLAQVKQEITRRVAGKSPPFDEVRSSDVERVLAALTTLDSEEWGKRWCQTGLEHEARGDDLQKRNAPGREIGDAYYLAYAYCHVGRYPVTSSPAKKEAYGNALRMFRKAARYFDTPLQLIEIPFEGKELVGYLQIPKGVEKPPVVMYWGGVDVWKEDHQRNSAIMHQRGLATFLIDGPGTGENPVSFMDPHAERTLLAAMDYLAARQDLDGSRIAVWGRSFGAYWAAKLAYMAPTRLKGAVFMGGNVHFGFQEKWLRPALTQTAENYLLGPSSFFDSRSYVLGVKTLDDVYRVAPSLSLKDMGLLDKPSAPILIVNGVKDDQAPIADSYLLLEHGDPKEARIYPDGGHMGVTPGLNPDVIATMVIDWLKKRLAQ